MKPFIYSVLSFALAVGALSGCGGNDPGPIIPPSGPAASAEDQQTSQSDALTSHEAALVNQGNSEPAPASKPDL
jgi:predicted small lipoprotein YifL